MNDPDKIGAKEEEARTTAVAEAWEQTDHNLYRYGKWFCFVKRTGTFKSVELYFYEEVAKAYVFIGSYYDFKKVVAVIEKAEAENGKAKSTGS